MSEDAGGWTTHRDATDDLWDNAEDDELAPGDEDYCALCSRLFSDSLKVADVDSTLCAACERALDDASEAGR